MFWNDNPRRREDVEEEWGDLGGFAGKVQASLELVDPAPSFRWELRERLLTAAAAEIAAREAAAPHRNAVPRGVLVGAGAAAAAAAAAGAILVYWRRNHPDGFGPLLHARGA
jgi:anti-sigma-K factor RskA